MAKLKQKLITFGASQTSCLSLPNPSGSANAKPLLSTSMVDFAIAEYQTKISTVPAFVYVIEEGDEIMMLTYAGPSQLPITDWMPYWVVRCYAFVIV